MPLSEQESRCVELLCHHLNQTTGGQWRVAKSLDDEHPSGPSPDVLLASDAGEIAVEIKRLTDGEVFDRHDVATRSLQRSLAPKTGGRFRLHPSRGVHLPVDKDLERRLRRIVPEIAAGLSVGESTGIPVRRQALVRCVEAKQGHFVSCWHHQTGDEVRRLSGDVDGTFYLDDADQPEHQFFSEECRLTFREVLRDACAASSLSGSSAVEWGEEWRLERVGDAPDGGSGVSLVRVAVDDPDAAAVGAVSKAVDDAKAKFVQADWAPLSAVALHVGERGWVLRWENYERAVSDLTAADVNPLDVVFLVADDCVRQFDYG